MNADNGSAIFGKKGKGQIVLDPSSNGAGKIYSYNFWKSSAYGENGIPTSYSSGNENGAGLLIDLEKPEIRFGSGNFSVNSQGYLVAKGGGSIAGWEIKDNELKSYNDTIILNSGAAQDTDIVFQAGDNFKVQADGALYAGEGYFVGEIESSSIKSSTISNGDGTFNVTSGGILTAKSGTIGGWTIDSTKLYCGETKLEVYGTYTEGEADKRYGVLTVPFIELNKTNAIVSGVGTQSGIIGWYKGDNGTTETDVIGIGTYDNSIVLESDQANIRLTVSNSSKIYLDGPIAIGKGSRSCPVSIYGNVAIGNSDSNYTLTINGKDALLAYFG